jgi:hypothetical protein
LFIIAHPNLEPSIGDVRILGIKFNKIPVTDKGFRVFLELIVAVGKIKGYP